MDPLVVFVMFTNIKNKYNFLLIKVTSTIEQYNKIFFIKRHNMIIR